MLSIVHFSASTETPITRVSHSGLYVTISDIKGTQEAKQLSPRAKHLLMSESRVQWHTWETPQKWLGWRNEQVPEIIY